MKFEDIWKNPWSYAAGGPGTVAGAAGALSVYSPSTFNSIFGEKDDSAEKNAALQREFAQHGLSWRVEDAKRAGIHPLAAIGFQGPSASPVYGMEADRGVDLPQMGQDLTRAFMATRGVGERAARYEAAQVDNMELQNDLLRSRLARENSAQVGPGIPTSVQPGIPAAAQEGGSIPDVGFARTNTGGLVPVPAKEMKNRIEDNIFHETGHFLRNNILPSSVIGGRIPGPPKSALPPGYDYWFWNGLEYKPAKGRDYQNNMFELPRR